MGTKFKVEITTDKRANWAANGLRFDTTAEAEAYAKDLTARWTSVDDWRVVEA